MYTKTIICLANSRKPPSGRCIAGKEFINGQIGGWVRPISTRSGHEVSEEERRYHNGTKAQLLDIVAIPLLRPDIQGHQVENHVLNDHQYWVKQGVATWQQVLAAVEAPAPAFWGSSQSTYHGLRDKVAEADVANIGRSLQLVAVNDLTVQVQAEAGFENNPSRRRVRARFTVLGTQYLLSVTDPVMEEHYLAQQDDIYAVGNAVLCISLVEVFHNFAFRVIASIITPEVCDAAAARP
ncbi:hypothetical protein QPK31_15135 [Massilia sp. YIM B02769]|uniref:dual OB domain-containing protein n=1 Tax=Massilia sp. YIM B02769 TaxID=3050129 RepID=UPI0025B72305|nr:hypothetical protein [Massilia sp. YIM B02769]MDN4059559.1 hypothetical protein [Massilia sp. YIM B02769]